MILQESKNIKILSFFKVFLYLTSIFICFSCEKLDLKHVYKIHTGTEDENHIQSDYAVIVGKVIDVGEFPIVNYGHVWSLNSNPRYYLTHEEAESTTDGAAEFYFKTEFGSRIAKKPFESELTNLKPRTDYFIRAYIYMGEDIIYGELMTIMTMPNPKGEVEDADGNVYPTVQIGDQWWMAENLRVTQFADHTQLVEGSGITAVPSTGDTYYYFAYNNEKELAQEYGLLYTWNTTVGSISGDIANTGHIQGVCPTDWHIPSDEEWMQLETYLGMDSSVEAFGWRGTDEGTHMKSEGTSDLNIIMSGVRWDQGYYRKIDSAGYYWTATSSNDDDKIFRQFWYESSQVNRDAGWHNQAFSVRCVKD